MHTAWVSLALASWLVLPQAQPAPATPPAGEQALPSVALPPALARVLTDYEREWGAKNAAGLAALFAEDGFVLAAGRPPVHGRAAIERHYTGSGGPLALRALAYGVEESTSYIIGAYASSPGEPDAGKFTLTLRKAAGGRWLIVSDMDNSNRRSGGAPAAGAGADLLSELTQVMETATRDWNRGDLDAFVAPYHERATFMARRGPIGTTDMRASYEKNYFTAGKPNQQLRYEQLNAVPVGGDAAMMTGRFILSGGDRAEQSGWFTLIWVRTPDGWKILHDHTS